MGNPQEAKESGALFYSLPAELDIMQCDILLRTAIAAINSSGWIWTAESCQGHPDETDLHAPWGFNAEPYIRFVLKGEDLGDATHALLAEAHDEDSLLSGPVPMRMHTRPLKNGWIELIVYIPAKNAAQRNRGCQAFERFGLMIQQINPLSKKKQIP